MKGYTDMPVERLERDLMDIKVYVESLSEFILDCDTPMTIAIQGDWGSGKTSMMNMIKQKVESKIVPIWFNTWQYSQFEMASYLSISLLSNFLEKIGAKEESCNLLRSIAKGALDFTKAAAVVVTEQVGGGTIAGHLRDTFSEINKQDAAKMLEELRDKIREAVNIKIKSFGKDGDGKDKDRIVVFIDDLDRLAPEKAVELLEVLKIFMDVPNCVFVLAVDYGVVTQGLEKKFGASVGHSKGKSFFDKIIQLPFAIPIAQYNISAYIKTLLSNMGITRTEGKINDEEINIYREIVDCSIGCNPRGMKRLFNSFILLNTVASKKGMFDETDGIKAEDKKRILFAALCLQMAFEEVYEFMIKNKDKLDANFFDSIKDSEKIKTDDALEEIRTIIPIKEDLYYSRITNFMELFYDCLQLDDDLENLSDTELKNLKNILSFSTITGKIDTDDSTREKETNNRKFWRYFLDKIKGRSKNFQNIRASDDSWLANSSGVAGISYFVAARRKYAQVQLSISRSSKDENKKIFDALEQKKAEIEFKMGKPLQWRRMDDNKSSCIESEMIGVNVSNPSDWSKMTEFLIEDVNKMESVFSDYVKFYGKVKGSE